MIICPLLALTLVATVSCTTAQAQTTDTPPQPTTAEWSSRIWAAASDGGWDAVDTLLHEVPQGEEPSLESFNKHLASYRNHRESEIAARLLARDEALEKMSTHFAEENILLAMQSTVKAQTLSESLDEIMYYEKVQEVLVKTQSEIETLTDNGNVLTAQMLLYYLRTFYEGTSRRDLYETLERQVGEPFVAGIITKAICS